MDFERALAWSRYARQALAGQPGLAAAIGASRAAAFAARAAQETARSKAPARSDRIDPSYAPPSADILPRPRVGVQYADQAPLAA